MEKTGESMLGHDGYTILGNDHKIKKIVKDNFSYFEIDDLIIKTGTNKPYSHLFIKENSFIIYGFEQSYYHVFLDALPQILLLKDTLKEDINIYIYFVGTTDQALGIYSEYYANKLIDRFCNILKNLRFNVKIFCINDYSTIHFEKILAINTRMLTFFHTLFPQHIIDYSSEEGRLLPTYVNTLRKTFEKHMLSIDKKPYQKIFLSRKKHSQKLRELKENILKLEKEGYIDIRKDRINHGVSFDSSLQIQKNGISTSYINSVVQGALQDTISRCISEEDEDKIEKFFYNNGYKILEFSEIDFYSQIQILSSSSHFASLSGGNLVNTIFLPDCANVFILNNNSKYSFDHDQYIDYRFKNVKYIFPVKKLKPAEDYSADQIITFIQENYLDIL